MLRALSGPLRGATFEVGARVLIGRVPACDILIVDTEVSREHAMIVTDGGSPTLVDLGSRNGTFVNGERVERVPLRPGDTFTISGSEFAFDRAAPISTSPVLSSRFGSIANASSSTREVASAKPSPDKDTSRSLAAVGADAAEAVSVSRPTVRLEAAGSAPLDKKTVQLQAVDEGAATEDEFSLRRTMKLPAAGAPEADAPDRKLDYVAAQPAFTEPVRLPVQAVGYAGEDLLFDITNYRSFRLRLQRGEIPTGEEVSNMIDLEAILREPSSDADPRRDVVAMRFFRRFEVRAALEARFTIDRKTVSLKGQVRDLSVDGLRCTLDFGTLNPVSNQLAVLLVESARDGVPVRYTITARVVWTKDAGAGFVLAGVPSWSPCDPSLDAAETVVRSRPES